MNQKKFVGVFLLVVVLTVSVTLAVAHDESGHYYACVNNASGTIHMVQSGDECSSNEELFVWNVKGVKGDKGDTGDVGPPGDDGADGADGASCSVTQNDGSATITCNGTSATINDGVDGADGAQGPEGPSSALGFYSTWDAGFDVVTAECDPGDIVSGGGFSTLNSPAEITYSKPLDDMTGWTVKAYLEIVPIQAFAVCADISQATAEICDGIDNDLDTEIDEDFPTLYEDCMVGIGVCFNEGAYVCTPDGSDVMCSAVPGVPTEAHETTCSDGLDNDCDGLTDGSDSDCLSS